MISLLTALKLTAPARWKTLVQQSLRTGSIPHAVEYLTRKGYPCSRAMLFTWLRKYPELLVPPPGEPPFTLPPPKGLPRGQKRQDRREGWQESEVTHKRKENRAAKRAAREEALAAREHTLASPSPRARPTGDQ